MIDELIKMAGGSPVRTEIRIDNLTQAKATDIFNLVNSDISVEAVMTKDGSSWQVTVVWLKYYCRTGSKAEENGK
jgi:hypothetical protein